MDDLDELPLSKLALQQVGYQQGYYLDYDKECSQLY